MHVVSAVDPHGLAARHGIRAGDAIEKINGEKLIDEIDFQTLISHRHVNLLIRRTNGEFKEIDIVKSPHVGLGIDFADALIGDPRSCSNNCVFCFIDQMPPNMRKTLYVKDDDWRMSLMMGNYVTLTNVNEKEFDRILARKASPLYISVHATDPQVRIAMMNNRHAGKLIERLIRLANEGLRFHCQIVLCPGLNDGEILEKTLNDLFRLSPAAVSVALVPVGLTQFRDGLTDLKPFTKDQALDVLSLCKNFQLKAREQIDNRFVYPSDEFICIADADLPEDDEYEGYPQIENGVGMIRLFEEQLKLATKNLNEISINTPSLKILIPCGRSILPYLKKWVKDYVPASLNIEVKAIINSFFGQTITVTGLIVGQDLLQQLIDNEADLIILADCMLNHENTHFLDDMPLDELRSKLKPSIAVIKTDGYAFIDAMIQADKLQKENRFVTI